MRSSIKRAALTACAGGAALVLVACSGSGGSGGGGLFPFSSASGGSSGRSSSSGPQFSLSQIDNRFSAMSALKPLAAKGKGSIAIILPVTATAKYFAKSNARDLKESFQKAGLTASQYNVQIRQGFNELSAAKTAIAKGASVLIVDARYSGVGADIESYAKAHSVPVIDYDYLTLGGTRKYLVGFDSLKVGVLLGLGLVNCVSAWRVKHPQVIVMKGASTDYNSALYAQGYDAVLASKFRSGWKEVSDPPGTWDPHVALREFQQQYTAHRNINAALIPNDENGAPIIAYLQSKGIKAKALPTTGLDATLDGLKNILAGYQCGTVYKPIYLEAQAAAALAMYVRAGIMPPSSLVNWNITDPQTQTSVASVLLTPEWVTTENMNSTIIADKFVPTSRLCAGKYASECSTAGIPS